MKRFRLLLVKPSRYDQDGYVLQWMRPGLPTNTMAVMYGLALDAAARRALGEDVEIEVSCLDEGHMRVRPERLGAEIGRSGGLGLAMMIGVQSCQYPRALDLARRFLEAGVPAAIGGFHVSGCLAMLPERPAELQQALDLGVSLFAGEAEGQLDRVLRDALHGTLQPIYNVLHDLPGLEGAPIPILPPGGSERSGGMGSFDAGRGCPFQCSFCTIINVQGRKSRFRSPDDVEAIVRSNLAQGIDFLFVTDDNLARNKNWEAIFDRLIMLREQQGVAVNLFIQVDTLCHRIPNFVDKAARAGTVRVFLGLENINPASLALAKKRQNRIAEYRAMLQEWKRVGCMTFAGYIVGFPADTPESIVRDVRVIQRELPLDVLEFFVLTPLPGSEDHKKLWQKGSWLEPDLNSYDACHVCAEHQQMTREEWEKAYDIAWRTYYTPEHMTRVIRRAAATGVNTTTVMRVLMMFWATYFVEKVHPLEAGLIRRKIRTDRRPGMLRESAILFYPRSAIALLAKIARVSPMLLRMTLTLRKIQRNRHRGTYMDDALTPVTAAELDTFEIFSATEAAREAAEKARRSPLRPPNRTPPLPLALQAAED